MKNHQRGREETSSSRNPQSIIQPEKQSQISY